MGSFFFVECPLGVAVSSQSWGLIRVRVWILSPWEASRRLIKIEVELKLDAQEDRGHNNEVGEGRLSSLSPPLMLSLSTPNTSDLAQSVPATHTVTPSPLLKVNSGILQLVSLQRCEYLKTKSWCTFNNDILDSQTKTRGNILTTLCGISFLLCDHTDDTP